MFSIENNEFNIFALIAQIWSQINDHFLVIYQDQIVIQST